MSTRSVKRRRLKQYAIGDLSEPIYVYSRNINPSEIYANYTEDYTEESLRWASISSVSGKHIFSDVNIDGSPVTHLFVIHYDEAVTAEKVIKSNNELYKIDHIIDPDNRHIFLELYCHLDGSVSKEANQ